MVRQSAMTTMLVLRAMQLLMAMMKTTTMMMMMMVIVVGAMMIRLPIFRLGIAVTIFRFFDPSFDIVGFDLLQDTEIAEHPGQF